MSNSTTNLDQILSSQANKEAGVNAYFDATSPATNFGRRASTTTGLTWGYYGATILVAGVPTQFANGTLALSNNTTNYVYQVAGVVAKVTSAPTGWPGPITSIAGAVALYSVVTVSSLVTQYTDYRLSTGAAGPAGAANEAWTVLTDAATVTPDCLSGTAHNFYWVIGGNRTLANPSNLSADGQAFNLVVKQDGTGTRVWTPGSKYKFCQSSNILSTPAASIDFYGGMYHSGLDIIIGSLAKAIA